MRTKDELFLPVRVAIQDAKLVAFDGCHKIYLAMDDEEAAWFSAEYPYIVAGTPQQMLDAVSRWWDGSCSLRFVQAVHSNHENPNAGYTSLIGQFADADDDDGNWEDDEE